MGMDPISSGVGLIGGLIGGIGGAIQRGKSNRVMSKLLGQDPSYTANPIASERLGLARTMLNARMPGAVSAERNIYGNQANQMANINRNATDASQALALGAAAGDQADNAFVNLGTQEAGNYEQRLNNLGTAQQGMINEGDKVYNDQLRRFDDQVQIRAAQNQNKQANWSSLSNFGGSLLNFGMAGGFNGMFAKKPPVGMNGNLMGGGVGLTNGLVQ